MLRTLTLATIALTGADHWTTYLCLRKPIDGWLVTEANPIADRLFDWAGLEVGLTIDSVVTLLAVLFLVTTPLFKRNVKIGLLGVIVASTSYAVLNNLGAISEMGLLSWPGISS